MSTATHVTTDYTTGGTWLGVYGSQGYYKLEGPGSGTLVSSLPSGLTIDNNTYPINNFGWTNGDTSGSAWRLQRAADATTRDEDGFYYNGTGGWTITPPDSASRRLAVYYEDGGTSGGGNVRSQTIQILQHSDSSILYSDTIAQGSAFGAGIWYVWDFTGTIDLIAFPVISVNFACFGMFFDATPGGTTTYIDPGTATETFTGASPKLKLSIPPATATETFTGASPKLKMSIKPATATETFTGASPKLKMSIKPATATETFTGASPTITIGMTKTPATATETFTGAFPKLKMSMPPATATETFTGAYPSLKSYIKPATATETFTMYTPGVSVAPTIQPFVLSSEIVSVLLEDDDNPFGIDPFRSEYLR